MPTLSKPSTDWARGIAKSLRKHLHPKVLKRRFSNKARIYALSTGKDSTKAPSKKSKSKPEKKLEKKLHLTNSVGVQASLPLRSLLEELSHEGSVDVMSYMERTVANSNANNSVDWRGQAQDVTKCRVKSTRGHKKPISGVGVLPSKVTPSKSSKYKRSSITDSSTSPPAYQYPSITAVCDASTNTAISSPPPVSLPHHRRTSVGSSHIKGQPTASTSSSLRHDSSSYSKKTQPTASSDTTSHSHSKRHQHASTKTSSSASSHIKSQPIAAVNTTSYYLSRHDTTTASSSMSSHAKTHTARSPSPVSHSRYHRSATQAGSSTTTSTNIISSSPPPDYFSKHRLSTAQANSSFTSSYARTQPTVSTDTTSSKHHHGTGHNSFSNSSPSRSHYGTSTTNTARSSSPPGSFSRYHISTTQASSLTTKSQPNASIDTSSFSLSKYRQYTSTTSSTSAPSAYTASNQNHHHSSSSTQHSAPISLADSYLRFSEQLMTTAAASLAQQSMPIYSSATANRPASPSVARRKRSGSLSNPATDLLDKKENHSHIDNSTGRSHTPVTSWRQRANSHSELPVTGHSTSPQLSKRDHSIPRSVYRSPSPSSRLRRSNSTSSVADCLKWEERKSSPNTTSTDVDIHVQRKSSPDTIATGDIHVHVLRKKSPRHRIRSLLRRLTSSKKMIGQATQVYISDNAIEQRFLEGGLVGLANLGNTCYMNSMLQCLSHTLEMTQIFLHPHFIPTKQLTKAYCQLMEALWQSDTPLSITTTTNIYSSSRSTYTSLYPGDFKRAMAIEYPQYSGNDQHDAQEFMRFLVSGLHDQMKREVSRKYDPFMLKDETTSHKEQADKAWHAYRQLEDSFISEVFMGQLKSTLQCSVCKGASVTFDPFWDICLPIPSLKQLKKLHDTSSVHLNDCIQEFTRKEVLDGDEKPVCASCRKAQQSIKCMTIQRFPPVLVLMLKRFTGYLYRSKLDTDVGIPQTLDLSAYASDDVKGQPAKYELYATSNHSGTVYFGHYTAWAKHYATQEWYEFDDKRVSKLTSSHPITKSTVHSSKPYVLFYRKAPSSDH